jgi:hypothetical protein
LMDFKEFFLLERGNKRNSLLLCLLMIVLSLWKQVYRILLTSDFFSLLI